MKGITLPSVVAIAVLASPAFAEDLCTTNMQKLSADPSALVTLASPAKEQFEEHKKAAEDAQSMGDEEACQSHAQKALLLLRKSDKDGEAGTD
ncbi:hypothetical protein [Pseudomonas sp. EA_35y_Pfl2_R5]|uniref:hypothetical protein n=1 Tax=Pseudomonas sp. EA_35y_Pfl2_R5 TaxID=3088690 RepID=UPI0030DD2554